MRKLFDNKTVVSSLGFVILVSLVWLVGPYLGLPSEQSRLYLIVGILLLWVFLLLLGRVLAERAGRMLDKMLRRQADEAVIGASADQRREANRAALESLYKEEFAREWKKFLQGVAIQDFGTLENTVQALGKLSDLQNSAIRQILTIAAQETSWDNPSRIRIQTRLLLKVDLY